MTDERTWEEFRATGLLWFVNQMLHVFGWAIMVIVDENDTNKVLRAAPARVKFRGFSQDVSDKGHERVTQYMLDNAQELLKEVREEDDK